MKPSRERLLRALLDLRRRKPEVKVWALFEGAEGWEIRENPVLVIEDRLIKDMAEVLGTKNKVILALDDCMPDGS